MADRDRPVEHLVRGAGVEDDSGPGAGGALVDGQHTAPGGGAGERLRHCSPFIASIASCTEGERDHRVVRQARRTVSAR